MQITLTVSQSVGLLSCLFPGVAPCFTSALEAAGTVIPVSVWKNPGLGIHASVPDPWTPIQTTARSAICWGREYAMDDNPLPTRIITADRQILHEPIELIVTIDGKRQAWGKSSFQWMEEKEAEVTGQVEAVGERGSLHTGFSVEFDGLMWIDIVVQPEDSATVDGVILEIPISIEYAKYLHACDATWAGSVAGTLPEKWEHSFVPFVWIGDEERGLQWLCESDEGWMPTDANRVITPEVTEDAAILCVDLLSSPLKPGQPFATRFGLQATPVKPLPEDHRSWHLTHGASYGMQNRSANLPVGVSYPAEGNISLERGSVDLWVKPTFDPATENVNHILFGVRLANGNHWGVYWNRDDKDLRFYAREDGEVHGYLERGRSDSWNQGEWKHVAFTWGDTLSLYLNGELVASQLWEGTMPGDLNDARICLGSGPSFPDPCDFLIDNLRISNAPLDFSKEEVQRFPPEPDEFTLLLDCFDLNGDETPAILDTVSMSANVTMATLSFVDCYWDGEQFTGPETGDDFTLPLDLFRAELMGRNRGLPAEFLSYENRPFTFEEALGLALLHDVPVRPAAFGDKLELMSKVWKLWEDFDVDSAKWVPYWSEDSPLATGNPNVLISSRVGNDHRILSVVVNVGKETADFDLSFSGDPSSVRDALTGEQFSPVDNKINLVLRPLQMRLLRVDNTKK